MLTTQDEEEEIAISCQNGVITTTGVQVIESNSRISSPPVAVKSEKGTGVASRTRLNFLH